jgi:hypothetical protein
MRSKNTYFHDRVVLFLLTANAFLTAAYMIIFFVGFDQSGSYIVQYRAGALVDEYKSGDAKAILAYPLFVLAVFIAQTVLSKKLHGLQKYAAWTVMFLSLIVIVLSILSTGALFKLR